MRLFGLPLLMLPTTCEKILDWTLRHGRATSVYLPHTVLPMLPPRLADDLCSLRANVDRLAMVIAMELDSNGEIVNSNAYEAVIRVQENLAYEEALGEEASMQCSNSLLNGKQKRSS